MKKELEAITGMDLKPFPNRLGNRGLPLTAEFGFHDETPLFTF
jgi:hypothetical protein